MKNKKTVVIILLFIFISMFTGSVYKLINYSELNTDIKKEFFVIGVTIVIAIILGIITSKVFIKK
jgi:predicted permease